MFSVSLDGFRPLLNYLMFPTFRNEEKMSILLQQLFHHVSTCLPAKNGFLTFFKVIVDLV
jgi:hypothetical protein